MTIQLDLEELYPPISDADKIRLRVWGVPEEFIEELHLPTAEQQKLLDLATYGSTTWNAKIVKPPYDKIDLDFSGLLIEEIDFISFNFPRRVSFDNCVLGREVRFFAAELKEASFYGTYFDEANFRSAKADFISFSSGYFKNARFQYTEFDTMLFQYTALNDADFTGAKSRYALFGDTIFKRADFSRVTFETADFNASTFWKANFTGAKLQRVRFERLLFGQANFSATSFERPAIFNIVRFRERASFHACFFHGTVSFRHTRWHRLPDFSNARFQQVPSPEEFEDILCRLQRRFTPSLGRWLQRIWQFSGRDSPQVKCGVFFRKIRLYYVACILAVRGKKAPLDWKSDANAPESLRFLRNLARAANDHHREFDYFAYEMRAHRYHNVPWSLKILYHLYGFLGDYGRSVIRPVTGLVLTTIVSTTWTYSLLKEGANAIKWLEVLPFTLANMLPFLGASYNARTFPEVMIENNTAMLLKHPVIHFISFGGGAFSLIFIFLIALALRNRFRL